MTSPEPPEKIDWTSPPPPKQRGRPKGSKWDALAAELKANPGRWARIGEDIPTSIVSVINHGDRLCFQPAGAFEAVTRNHTSRWQADVYVRYVGENQEHS